MSFQKCDVYQECQAAYDAVMQATTGCCGTPQCPNVVLPHREFRVGHYGEWAPEVEFKFHALCVTVGQLRAIIAELVKRLDVQADTIARLHGTVGAPMQLPKEVLAVEFPLVMGDIVEVTAESR
jgi:hypothetical protein